MRLLSCLLAAGLLLLPASGAWAQLSSYSQDFEGLNQVDGAALSDDGWNVFANVFDPTGTTFLYNYGVFPAPNGTGAFSNVTDVIGGAPVGLQGLVTFSDYNNGDHNVGNRIQTNVFQEQTIGSGDIGKTAVFEFIAKPGDLGGASTARAFIKTLDPGAGFAETNIITLDTDSLPAGNSSLSITLPNLVPALDGQILQFGFETTAANFDPSGVNYDNINFSVVPEPGAMSLAGLALLGFVGRRRR